MPTEPNRAPHRLQMPSMKTIILGVGASVVVASCAPDVAFAQDGRAPSRPEYVEPRVCSAAEAVSEVALSPTSGLAGQFAFIVRGWGRDGGRIFLNSQADYRDAGTLTVALSGPAADALAGQTGGSLDQLVGRTIVATGVARRVRINLTYNGRATEYFYFQTHVPVSRANDLRVVPGEAVPVSATP